MLGEVLADVFADDPVFAWLIPPLVRGRDGRLRPQLQIERLHAGQRPPHWYLGYLGTRPDRQGQGLGNRMLQQVLPGLDAGRVPAYLESSSERNLPLYERNGFRVVGELRALGNGPALSRMWREPQPPPRCWA